MEFTSKLKEYSPAAAENPWNAFRSCFHFISFTITVCRVSLGVTSVKGLPWKDFRWAANQPNARQGPWLLLPRWKAVTAINHDHSTVVNRNSPAPDAPFEPLERLRNSVFQCRLVDAAVQHLRHLLICHRHLSLSLSRSLHLCLTIWRGQPRWSKFRDRTLQRARCTVTLGRIGELLLRFIKNTEPATTTKELLPPALSLSFLRVDGL